jgi:hypothetical protein
MFVDSCADYLNEKYRVYMLNECISYFVNNGSPVYTSFLDNAKAFDKIWMTACCTNCIGWVLRGKRGV